MKTKKLIAGILVSILLFTGTSSLQLAFATEAGGETRTFITTAYYSPLSDQEYYLTGSYESEIRLNGRGTNGADGTEVYPGMLAAPKTYPFGTQIYFEGLGMGTVHDRGGAIVSAGERGQGYDRIDIWMGQGDEGLARALNWGKRTVTGIIYWTGGQAGTLEIGNVAKIPIKHLPKQQSQTQTPVHILKVGVSGDEVTLLQKDLTELGFFHEAITGYYGEITREAVLQFQFSAGVIGDSKTVGAGDYGPRTSAALKKILDEKHAVLLKDLKAILPELSSTLEPGGQGEAIAKLQGILYGIGYFQKKPDGRYDAEMEAAILDFQMQNGVVGSAEAFGAGVFGPKTRAKLLSLIESRQLRLANAYPPVMVTTEYAGDITPPLPQKLKDENIPQPVFPISNLLAVEFPAISNAEGTTAFAGVSYEPEMEAATFE